MVEFLWLLAVAGGPLLLVILIAYAMTRRRRLTPPEEAAQHEAVERLYDKNDPGPPHPRPDYPDTHRRTRTEPRSAADLAVADHLADHHADKR